MPKDVDPATGDLCDECVKSYRYFYLHAERNDCVEPSEGPETHFSCWREGTRWESDDTTVLFGRTCPAQDRMPLIGSALAETVTIPIWILRLVIETLVVIPAAVAGGGWAGISEIMRPRLGRQTFHSMLDSTGAHFLSVEEIIRILNRAALYLSTSLVCVIDAFDGRPGVSYVKPVIAGTTKILQHSDGFVVLSDPISKQLDSIRKLPSTQVLGGLSDAATNAGMTLPMGMRPLSRLFVTMSSATSLNLRIIRRVLIRLLRSTDVKGALTGVVLAAIYESEDDFESFTGSSRLQCHGLVALR